MLNININITGAELVENTADIVSAIKLLREAFEISSEEIPSEERPKPFPRIVSLPRKFKIRGSELAAMGITVENWKLLTKEKKAEMLAKWPDRRTEFLILTGKTVETETVETTEAKTTEAEVETTEALSDTFDPFEA